MHDSAACTTVPTCGDTFLAHETRAYVRDRATLSAHVVEGRAIDEFCHDRLPTVFCRDRDFSVTIGFSRPFVATENPGTWDFPYRDLGLMFRQCMVEVRGDRAPWARDRANHAHRTRDSAPNVCDHAHNRLAQCIVLCTVCDTVHGHYSQKKKRPSGTS